MKKGLPIRSKIEIAQKIGEVLECLHAGKRSAADALIEEIKKYSLYLEDPIQQDVLIFAESVQFQMDYDPWHRMSEEIRHAANKLIEDLGFTPPSGEDRYPISL